MKNKKILYLILIISVSVVLGVVLLFFKGINLISLKSDINDVGVSRTATNDIAFTDWNQKPNTLSSKYSDSTIFLNEKTYFQVKGQDEKGNYTTKSVDVSKFQGETTTYNDWFFKKTPSGVDGIYYRFGVEWVKYNISNKDYYFPRVQISLIDDQGDFIERLTEDQETKLQNSSIKFKPGFTIIVKNSAIDSSADSDDNLMDAVITTKNIKFWHAPASNENQKYKYKSSIKFFDSYCLSYDDSTTTQAGNNVCSKKVDINIGSPLEFSLYHEIGSVDATLAYYHHYGESNQKEATIAGVNALFSDIDIYNKYYSEYPTNTYRYYGHEAVSFSDAQKKKVVYYDSTGKAAPTVVKVTKNNTPYDVNYNARLTPASSGIYSSADTNVSADINGNDIGYTSVNVNGYSPRTTIFAVEDFDGKSSYFNFGYSSARAAGIGFIFVSPIRYDIEKPCKSVDVKKTTDEKEYTYTVSQYIPNNYYGGMLDGFNTSSTSTSTLYKSIKIIDTLSNKVTINTQKNIIITDASGKNVTNKFTITVSGNTVTAVTKSGVTNESTFYNNTYNLKIPVKTIKNINAAIISNSAKIVVDDSLTLESNRVDVKVYYTVTTRYIDEATGKEILSPKKEEKYYGDNYSTVKEDIPGYNFSKNDGDSTSGIVNTNKVINYYYNKKDAKININYVEDGNTSNILAPKYTEVLKYGDSYDADNIRKNTTIPDGYELVRHESSTDKLSGTVENDEINITFFYKKIIEISNPKTLDNIMSYIIYGVLATVGIFVSILVIIKLKKQDKN